MCGLDRALGVYARSASRQKRFARYTALGQYVRDSLRHLGIEPLVPDQWASPVNTTVTPPKGLSPRELVSLCREWGYDLYGHSDYLVRRGWVQVATMGAVSQADLRPFFDRLRAWMRSRPNGSEPPEDDHGGARSNQSPA